MMRAVVIGMSMLALPAIAAEVGGVHFDDTATVGGKKLVLNGAGMRSMVVVQVYAAGLYVPDRVTTADAALAATPRRVQLSMVRSLSAERLIEALDEGLAKNNTPAELSGIHDEHAQLTKVMRKIGEAKKGDVITIDYADGATIVGLNGTTIGTVAGEDFGRALFKVWLGDQPVQQNLKDELLAR